MVFSDIGFIFFFLPVFLFLYFFIPQRFRTPFLFAGSLVFYLIGSLERPEYFFLLILTVILTYFSGLLISKFKKRKKPIFVFTLILLFGTLIFFKYTDFLFSGINGVIAFSGVSEDAFLPLLNLALPLGLSFYIFQAVSYVADVYSEKYAAERSFVKFGAYLCMFPYLLSGPLVSYDRIRKDLTGKRFSLEDFSEGLKIFVLGLGLKVILANNVGGLWRETVKIGFDSVSTPLAWLAVAAYSFQLYFDFYGYSLMAKGLGRILGFNVPDNFRSPYMSLSMTEFWRRWHITLGQWFKKYIYIPLGGNRKGGVRTFLNLLVVWLFTGLWHGSSLNFVVWGLFLFVIIIIEKSCLKKYLDRFPLFGHIYMFILIPVSWVIFAVSDFGSMGMLFSKLFPFFSHTPAAESLDFLRLGKSYAAYLVAGAVFSTGFPGKIYARFKNGVVAAIFLAAVFGASVYCLYRGLNDPFMYFKF